MNIFNRHKHNWKLVAKTYTKTYWDKVEHPFTLRETEFFRRGDFTTILWECRDKTCDGLRERDLPGVEIS